MPSTTKLMAAKPKPARHGISRHNPAEAPSTEIPHSAAAECSTADHNCTHQSALPSSAQSALEPIQSQLSVTEPLPSALRNKVNELIRQAKARNLNSQPRVAPARVRKLPAKFETGADEPGGPPRLRVNGMAEIQNSGKWSTVRLIRRIKQEKIEDEFSQMCGK